jgi:hypothetical protein
MHQGQQHHHDLKKLLPTLDIGSHSNARFQPLPEAGARHERTLEAVGCKPVLYGVILTHTPFRHPRMQNQRAVLPPDPGHRMKTIELHLLGSLQPHRSTCEMVSVEQE